MNDNRVEGFRNKQTYNCYLMLMNSEEIVRFYYAKIQRLSIDLMATYPPTVLVCTTSEAIEKEVAQKVAIFIEDRLQCQYEALNDYLNHRRLLISKEDKRLESKILEDEMYIHTQHMQDGIDAIDFLEVAESLIERYKESKS